MNQPDLGRRIAKLRQQHGLTQEDLAETCEMNVRSLQRIEAGETMPRASTIRKLEEVLTMSITNADNDNNSFWLVLMHLSSIVPIVVVALAIWVWKRGDDSRVAVQGVDVLNFQMSMWLYLMLASLSVFVLIGLLILPLMGIAISVITIVNTLKVAQGHDYRYPFSIGFVPHKG